MVFISRKPAAIQTTVLMKRNVSRSTPRKDRAVNMRNGQKEGCIAKIADSVLLSTYRPIVAGMGHP